MKLSGWLQALSRSLTMYGPMGFAISVQNSHAVQTLGYTLSGLSLRGLLAMNTLYRVVSASQSSSCMRKIQ